MNTNYPVERLTRTCFAALLLLSAAAVQAGSDTTDSKSIDLSKQSPPAPESGCQTPDPLEIRIGLPGWISHLGGDMGVKGIVAPLDIGFDTLLRHIDAVPIVLSGYLRYNRWEFFGDGEYIQLHDSVTLPDLLFTNANFEIKYAFINGFIGYRVINCDQASLSLYTGVRYNYYSGTFHIADNQDPRFPILRQLLGIPRNGGVSDSIGWVDPVLGLSGRYRICKPVSFWVSGDVGGFDANGDDAFKVTRIGGRPTIVPAASSDWSYQVQGGLEFQLTRKIWSQVGWRYLKYDFKTKGFVNQTDLNGPFLQTGINF